MKLIVFKQNNCRPCDILANVLEHDLGVEADLVVNLSIPTEEGIELAGKYGVMSTPVIVLEDEKGELLREIRGVPTRGDIESIFEQRGLL